MRTPHALVRACRPTTPPRSRPSRLLARLPPGEPDETVHSPSTRLAVAPTTEPAAGRSTRTPWRTPRHASHYAAMTTQHSAHPPLPSAASLSLSISPLSFASTSLASFVPRLQWRAHKGCLGSDVSGTWWERTLTWRKTFLAGRRDQRSACVGRRGQCEGRAPGFFELRSRQSHHRCRRRKESSRLLPYPSFGRREDAIGCPSGHKLMRFPKRISVRLCATRW